MAAVTVIIPNYNGRELLRRCIASLERQTFRDFRLIVVDNGSTDGSREERSSLPDFEMVALPRNTGFCHAVNVGIRHAKTPYVILLNNDAEAEPGFVGALLDGIRSSGRIFSGNALMLDYKDPSRVDNAGDYYTLLGWAVARGKGRDAARFSELREVFSCCGGASIYRVSALRRIGLFDERHFAYLEDVDIGYRARLFGYRNVFIPEARVRHVGSATAGGRYSTRKVFLAARNSVYVAYKNMPPLQLFFNAPFLAAGVLIKALFFLKKGFAREYLCGIARGISICRSLRRVPFRMRRLGAYLRVEADLVRNIWRILRDNFCSDLQ